MLPYRRSPLGRYTGISASGDKLNEPTPIRLWNNIATREPYKFSGSSFRSSFSVINHTSTAVAGTGRLPKLTLHFSLFQRWCGDPSSLLGRLLLLVKGGHQSVGTPAVACSCNFPNISALFWHDHQDTSTILLQTHLLLC